MKEKSIKKWAIKWQSENKLNGKQEWIMFGETCLPLLFHTRKTAKEYRDMKYGYIAKRKDLRNEPFGWKMPKIIRVEVIIKEVNE